MSARLKSETADAHHRAERHPLMRDLMGGKLPPAKVVAYFGQLFLVHKALETVACRGSAWEAFVPAADQRHSERLATDLAAAGVTLADIEPVKPVARALEEINHAGMSPRVIGMIYVLEGSMNGNRYIAQPIRGHYGSATRMPMAYLDSYGTAQPARWAAFKQKLDTIQDPANQTEALAGAVAMFDLIHDTADAIYAS